MDIQTLKANIDLREVIEDDLGVPYLRGGEARLWKCPFHGEKHGHSLVVWHDGWRCFGACQVSGDVLDWLQMYRGLSFRDAHNVLRERVRGSAVVTPPRPRTVVDLPPAAPPDISWQAVVRPLLANAEKALWSDDGRKALTYLRQRGLTDETIRAARIGLIPGHSWEWRRVKGITISPGLTLPWWHEDDLWAVRVRRSARVLKYVNVTGSSTQGLYRAGAVQTGTPLLFVEGEFDALLAAQEAQGRVNVVTLGSATSRLNACWLPLLAHCTPLLIAYDTDMAGASGATRLQKALPQARVVQIPAGKDITEFIQRGGDFRAWLESLL